MYVLGIESSCDETSAAIVKDGKTVLSNVVSSSLSFHSRYGGVIPEIASRMSLETISEVTESCFSQAGLKLKNIDLISVTNRPGLLGSLLVGISFAKGLALGLKVPLLGVDHILAHIYANLVQKAHTNPSDRIGCRQKAHTNPSDRIGCRQKAHTNPSDRIGCRQKAHTNPSVRIGCNEKQVKLPFVALIVSGGHTSLFFVKDYDNFELLASTQDDACGEAFDKVAKLLGLGYPGGPIIEKLALKGNPDKFKFNCSDTKAPLNFSFSGIKTAVLYKVKAYHNLKLSEKADIAASFQKAAIDTLIKKTILACEIKKVNTILVGGGVAANNKLRETFEAQAKVGNIEVYFPPKDLCMDNAAMVAGFGYQLYKKGAKSELNLSAGLG